MEFLADLPQLARDFYDGVQAIVEALPAWLVAITAVVTAARLVTALTPTKVDDVWLDKLLGALQLVSLAVGKNKRSARAPGLAGDPNEND